jgi:hypothetical protein
LLEKTPYIEAIAYYEPEKLMALAMVNRQIKLYRLGEVKNARGGELLVDANPRKIECSFIPTSISVERHKVSKLLIACLGGDAQIEVVVIDENCPHEKIGGAGFGSVIFTAKLSKR